MLCSSSMTATFTVVEPMSIPNRFICMYIWRLPYLLINSQFFAKVHYIGKYPIFQHQLICKNATVRMHLIYAYKKMSKKC